MGRALLGGSELWSDRFVWVSRRGVSPDRGFLGREEGCLSILSKSDELVLAAAAGGYRENEGD